MIDTLVPLQRRGKAGLFSGAGVGKTVPLTEMIHNMIGNHEGVSLFCGIGECCREAEELYREFRQAGVLPNMVAVLLAVTAELFVDVLLARMTEAEPPGRARLIGAQKPSIVASRYF